MENKTLNIEDVILERVKISNIPIEEITSQYNEIFKVINHEIELKDSCFYNNDIETIIAKMMAVVFQMKNILLSYNNDIIKTHDDNPGFVYCEIDKYEKIEYLLLENPFSEVQYSQFEKDTVNTVNILRDVVNSISSCDIKVHKNIKLSKDDILIKIDEFMYESIVHYIDTCIFDTWMMSTRLKYLMKFHRL